MGRGGGVSTVLSVPASIMYVSGGSQPGRRRFTVTAEADQDETAGWRLADPWAAESRRLDESPPLEPDEDWLAGLDAPEPAWATQAAAAGRDMPVAGYWREDSSSAGSGFEYGGGADKLAPGPLLAGLLDLDAPDLDAGLPALNDDELVGYIGAARRMESWAAALKSGTIATLTRRRAIQAKGPGRRWRLEHLSDELAAALTIPAWNATKLLRQAGQLDRLPDVRAALQAGTIDWDRAMVFAEILSVIDDDAKAQGAAAQVLPKAGGLTTRQIRDRLIRITKKIDPEADARRRKEGRRDTSVQLCEESSGNCSLSGRELPPARALASDKWLTAQAWWLRNHGMTGTLDQLRVAVFLAVLGGGGLASLLTSQAAQADPRGTGTPRPSPADAAAGDTGGPGTPPRDDDGAVTGERAADDPARD